LETTGAVKRPVLEIVPLDACQVTPVLAVPRTQAVNCWDPPEAIVAAVGDTDILTAGAALMVMTALACTVGSATLVAVIMTLVLLDTTGAVNSPVLAIVPALADQVTAVWLVPGNVAPNCLLAPETRLPLLGFTVRVMEGTGKLPQPKSGSSRIRRAMRTQMC
jgi:hypothetical protein